MPIARPINTIQGTWKKVLEADRLRRSSQNVSVIGQKVCIYGGEVEPRQPVDNKVDTFELDSDTPSLETSAVSNAPSPRVGSASAVIDDNMYLFSGRGSIDMAPVEENGAVWRFNSTSSLWTKLIPAEPTAPYPPARSYHCAASDLRENVFIHAGCPTKGRLSDLWSFNTSARIWTQLPDAPAPQRGGTSIAYSSGKLFRMNGFDGTKEQGGSVDIFDLSTNTWSSETFKADGHDGPEPRSVCTLLPVHIARKDKLLTIFGERDPSSLGHAGAGKMLSDVWIYDISERWWTQLSPKPDSEAGTPNPRGWFDADVIKSKSEGGNDSIIIHGGLSEHNTRLADVWRLDF